MIKRKQVVSIYLAGLAYLFLTSLNNLWSGSIDFSLHYSVVRGIRTTMASIDRNSGIWGAPFEYSTMSHKIAALLSQVVDSDILAIQMISMSALFIIWTIIFLLIRLIPGDASLYALIIITFSIVLNDIWFDFELWGNEIISNYFYSQIVAQSFSLIVIFFFIRNTQTHGIQYANMIMLALGIWMTSKIHLVPALVLLGVMFFICLTELKKQKINYWTMNLLGIFLFILSLILVGPDFAAMRYVSSNNGSLVLRNSPDSNYLIGYALILSLLSFILIRISSNQSKLNNSEHLIYRILAFMGISVSALCTIQKIALYLNVGSEYAVKKYAFSIYTLILLTSSIILGVLFNQIRKSKQQDVLRKRLNQSPYFYLICAFLTLALIMPRSGVVKTSELVHYEKLMTELNNELPRTDRKVIVLKLGVGLPAFDFMYTSGIFGTPFYESVEDVVINRELSTIHKYKYLITSEKISSKNSELCLLEERGSYLIYDHMCIRE
jgi:hypothetical protein